MKNIPTVRFLVCSAVLAFLYQGQSGLRADVPQAEGDALAQAAPASEPSGAQPLPPRPPATRILTPSPTTALSPPSPISAPTRLDAPPPARRASAPPTPPRAAATPPAAPARAPVDQVAAARPPISLEVSKGTLVRLPRPAATVFVADSEIADVQVKSPSIVYVFARKPGETVLYAVSDNDQVLANVQIRVTHNLSGLRQAIRGAIGDQPVDISTADNTLLISGAVTSPVQAENVRRIASRFVTSQQAADKAAELVNQVRVIAPNQVNLRVRVVEVSRETIKALGFNWDAVFNNGSLLLGIATGNPVVNDIGQLIVRNTFGSFNTSSIVGSFRKGNVDINSVIDALDQEGLISILAEPNLTALSGETASFLAGGEFPIPVPQQDNVITILFKQFGVSLAFTPTLLDANRISLRVRPEVSQLSTSGQIVISGFVVPALTTRRAETTVELASGQTFAIAGLLQNNITTDVRGLPFLSQVPVLGKLFGSDRFRRNETELVIIVTPYIVRPTNAVRLATPADGLVPPRDVERMILGSSYREQLPERAGGPRGPTGQTLIGPVGFILE